ncbi:MAG: Wzz/FepE/Etk N-terminal domain-containing protein [Mucinivorans sp.]
MDNKFDVFDILKQILAAKRKLIKWGVMGLVMGAVIAFSIPRTYTSSTLISPESKVQESSAGQMGALASLAGINLQSGSGASGMATQLYPVIIGTTPFLMELAEIQVPYKEGQISLSDYILYEQKEAWWSYIMGLPSTVIALFSSNNEHQTIYTSNKLKARYIVELANRLAIDEDKKTKTITISASMQSAVVSYVVVDSVFSRLKVYVAKYQTEKLRTNLDNTIQMLDQAKKKYYLADEKYADATDSNQNLIRRSAQVKLDRLFNEKELTFSVYQQLAGQVESARIKLLEQTPIATVLEPAAVPLTSTSPNKKLIIVMWTILGVLGAALQVGIKAYSKNSEHLV